MTADSVILLLIWWSEVKWTQLIAVFMSWINNLGQMLILLFTRKCECPECWLKITKRPSKAFTISGKLQLQDMVRKIIWKSFFRRFWCIKQLFFRNVPCPDLCYINIYGHCFSKPFVPRYWFTTEDRLCCNKIVSKCFEWLQGEINMLNK